MSVRVVTSVSPRRAIKRGHAALWSIQLGAALVLLVQAGCTKARIRPGATYLVSIITKGNDGKAAPQESATRIESAATGSEQELTYAGQTLSLVVRKTQFGKATFDITFPDKVMQRIQVRAGETKDILPSTQKIGVRIELQESH
jgi:hypothetical protein